MSSSDTWAVGGRGSQGGKTLIERWDGTAWSVIPNPVSFGQLRAVTALSSEDAWAVGQSISQTLVENWDGTQWVEVPSPNIGTYDLLAGVYAISTNDVWAVGYKDYDANNNTASTFTLHWNGTAWSEIPSPNVDSANYLAGVEGASSDDVWAVGTSTSGPIPFHTLALH